ncbi:glycoside hydrolase family 31 protein [Xylaria bambusicola]|uniref:glycoside hydrolase family 31 protein n=1 Tax=Xylaria bambusicola TaxID=326684 RepID=UPI0020086B5A|nr:glycoside hydrolase family 31 protein [Xylaria bambusicola]KAI0505593.1 glycoside hydrolase family 31 protein [Xylaria bambusicola]
MTTHHVRTVAAAWSPPLPHHAISLFYTRFADWYDHLTPLSQFLLLSSILASSSFVSYASVRVKKRRGETSRVMILLAAMLFILASLVLSLPSPSPAEHVLPSRDDVAVIPNIHDPDAVDPQSVCPGYKASNVIETPLGLTADLILAGGPCNAYGTDVEALSLVVEYQAADRLHVEILPKYLGPNNQSWFILPDALLPKPKPENEDTKPQSDLDFTWSNEPTFSFQVTRKSTSDVLFTTGGSQLVYQDQFIEFSSALPENYNLYGLGETIHSFRLGNNLTRTLYNADVGDIIDANLYGFHPIYLDTRYFTVTKDGSMKYAAHPTDKTAQYKSFTHGVFHRNAHIQEVLLRESRITWRSLGGTIDLYFFRGPTQDEVTKTYQKSTIGLPAMQQYWTFGYHQCRWGYQNWTVVQEVVDNFAKHEIPLETVWNDIDYMKAYRDFENDPDRYPYDVGAKFLADLHENNQHYIPIIDAGIYVPIPGNESDEYPPFERGLEQGVFVSNPDGSLYIGQVWPGYCAWADWIGALFSGIPVNQWWISEVTEYHKKIPFDGIWIDMSEVASFCVGSCGSSERDYGFIAPDSTSSSGTTGSSLSDPRNVDFPPYAINNYHGALAGKTLSPNATHSDGTVQYDFHNVWGHQLLNATYHALLNISPKKRPFIIGRSTFAGSGRVAGHWGGDNYSNWPYLYFSIPQALSFSLYGMPMFGVDTCGFSGNATEELCNRWMQLSAFFPFYRNHNEINAISQEPYLWPSVIEASKKAMKIRYALLPYIYTTFFLSHSTGSTTMRALAWEFPEEPWLADADRQFMLGSALLVTPVLEQGATTVDGVFPGVGFGAIWYDWYDQTRVTNVEAGQNMTISAPLGHIPVFVRGGSVIPMQEPGLTTTAVRASPWSLLAALDVNSEASGNLYLDDGESLEPEATAWITFSVSKSSLTVTRSGTYDGDKNPLGYVTILGVEGEVHEVAFGDAKLDSETWHLDAGTGVLKVEGLDAFTAKGAWTSNWTLSWSAQ